MTQNQKWIESNFHGKRAMYGGFALLDHSLLLSLITGTDHEDRPGRPCKHMHLDYDKIIMIVMELKVKWKKF